MLEEVRNNKEDVGKEDKESRLQGILCAPVSGLMLSMPLASNANH